MYIPTRRRVELSFLGGPVQIMDIFYVVNELHALDVDEVKRAVSRGKVKGSDRPAFAFNRGLNKAPHRVNAPPTHPPSKTHAASFMFVAHGPPLGPAMY